MHVPPHPPTFITASCCPQRTTAEVMRSEWLFAAGMALLTSGLCVVLAVMARQGVLRLAIWVGGAAALTSLFFASDLALSLHIGNLSVSFNLALVAVAAFVTSLVIYVRARRLGLRSETA